MGVNETIQNDIVIGATHYYANSPVFRKRCWDALHHGPPYRETGPFTLFKSGLPFAFSQGNGVYIGTDYRPSGLDLYSQYTGGFWPNTFGPTTIGASDMTNVGVSGTYGPDYGAVGDGEGAAARNKFKPKLNSANLGQTIGEFRQLVPMLNKSARGFHELWKSMGGHGTDFGPRVVADHFINHQFGWLPFVRDIVDSYDTYQNTAKKLRQLQRDNGKWIHRGGTVSTESNNSPVTTTENLAGFVFPALPTAFYRKDSETGGKRVSSMTYTTDFTRTWFEGRFRYYVPSLMKDNDNYYKVINRIHMYGARISPSLLWKITPWTWLADWGSTAGDIVSNAEDNLFGLACKYSCIMRHTSRHAVNNSTIRLKNGDVGCVWYQEVDVKRRHGGYPYGFGLGWEAYNPSQIAVLAALGITRH
jgi:hypothetical protein